MRKKKVIVLLFCLTLQCFLLNKNFLIISYICEKFKTMISKPVKGFSKLSKEAKMEWIANEYLGVMISVSIY